MNNVPEPAAEIEHQFLRVNSTADILKDNSDILVGSHIGFDENKSVFDDAHGDDYDDGGENHSDDSESEVLIKKSKHEEKVDYMSGMQNALTVDIRKNFSL